MYLDTHGELIISSNICNVKDINNLNRTLRNFYTFLTTEQQKVYYNMLLDHLKVLNLFNKDDNIIINGSSNIMSYDSFEFIKNVCKRVTLRDNCINLLKYIKSKKYVFNLVDRVDILFDKSDAKLLKDVLIIIKFIFPNCLYLFCDVFPSIVKYIPESVKILSIKSYSNSFGKSLVGFNNLYTIIIVANIGTSGNNIFRTILSNSKYVKNYCIVNSYGGFVDRSISSANTIFKNVQNVYISKIMNCDFRYLKDCKFKLLIFTKNLDVDLKKINAGIIIDLSNKLYYLKDKKISLKNNIDNIISLCNYDIKKYYTLFLIHTYKPFLYISKIPYETLFNIYCWIFGNDFRHIHLEGDTQLFLE